MLSPCDMVSNEWSADHYIQLAIPGCWRGNASMIAASGMVACYSVYTCMYALGEQRELLVYSKLTTIQAQTTKFSLNFPRAPRKTSPLHIDER